MKSSRIKLVVVAAVILQLGAVTLAKAAASKITVGKEDDIILASITQVGDLTLQPGHYLLEHKMGRGTHAMHFVGFIPYEGNSKARFYYGSTRNDVGAAKCRLEPLNAKVEQTQAFFVNEGGMTRITKIKIKGENVAHLF